MIMDTMKDRPRITRQMDKVCTIQLFIILGFFIIVCFINKFFWNDGDRYEDKFKEGKQHGQGKKEVIYFMNYGF